MTERAGSAVAGICQVPSGHFIEAELADLPEPVQRYFRTAIAPGTRLARTVSIEMRGTIRLGRWLPFRAQQLLNPHRGFIWRARVGWIVGGADRYVAGEGGMDWSLLGVKRLVHAAGPDVTRSAAARGASEAVWIPTAVLPQFGVAWTAADDDHIQASWVIDGHPFSTNYELDGAGRITSIVFDRWGDPDETGTWGIHPFGGEIETYANFGGLTVPSSGRIGWFYGTDRWDEGEFFRFRITALAPVDGNPPRWARRLVS